MAVWRWVLALLFLLSLIGLGLPANAYLKAGSTVMPGVHNVLKGGTVQDGMATSLSAAYSFRRVRDAYAGSAVKLRRTTGGTLDVGFTASGDFDSAAAATFCAATSCFLDTWYDQSTNARLLQMATLASQPSYVADCGNSLPCARMTGSQRMDSVLAVTPSAVGTLNTVARTGTAGACYWFFAGNNGLMQSAPDVATLYPGGGGINAAAASLAWHSLTGVLNGASSLLRVDGAETTGSLTGAVTSAAIAVSTGGATCDVSEAAWWNNYAMTAGERQALAENQRNYWTPLPLDTFQTPAAAYSMRRLKSAYSGPGIRLRRASDNAEADIPFLGFTSFTGAPIDTAAANAHCAATTCTVVTWYDQSGNARHATQAVTAEQPPFAFNCLGALPCVRTTTAAARVTSAATVPVVAPMSFSAVGNYASGPGRCAWPYLGNNTFSNWAGIPGNWLLYDQVGYIAAAAVDGAWHAGIGVMAGAASAIRIDVAETTGTVVGWTGTAAISPFDASDAATTCSVTESVYWSGYGLTGAERAVLTANQRSFWAIP